MNGEQNDPEAQAIARKWLDKFQEKGQKEGPFTITVEFVNPPTEEGDIEIKFRNKKGEKILRNEELCLISMILHTWIVATKDNRSPLMALMTEFVLNSVWKPVGDLLIQGIFTNHLVEKAKGKEQ